MLASNAVTTSSSAPALVLLSGPDDGLMSCISSTGAALTHDALGAHRPRALVPPQQLAGLCASNTSCKSQSEPCTRAEYQGLDIRRKKLMSRCFAHVAVTNNQTMSCCIVACAELRLKCKPFIDARGRAAVARAEL